MKIALVSVFYPYRGGIAQFNNRLYQALQARATVKAFTFSRQYPDFLFPGKTQYVAQTDPDPGIEAERLLDSINPFSWQHTAKRVAAWKPDLVLMRYWMSFFAPSLGWVAGYLRRRGIRVISIVDNAIPHEPHFFDGPLARMFFRRNSGLVSLCEAVHEDLTRLAPKSPKASLFHPLYDDYGEGLDPVAARRALGLDPTKKTLLYFGFIREYKGLDLLLQAMDLLDDDYQLVAAGECYGSFEPYQKIIDGLKHPERVLMMNRYITNAEVATLFSAADACVLPYRSATQSGIMAMAYHFEIPVLVTPVGGLSQAIETAHTGLVIVRPEVGPIAQAARAFYSAGGRSAFLPALQKIKQTLSWDNFADALLDFSRSLPHPDACPPTEPS